MTIAVTGQHAPVVRLFFWLQKSRHGGLPRHRL